MVGEASSSRETFKASRSTTPDCATPPPRTMMSGLRMRMTISRPRASQRVASRRIWVAGESPSAAACTRPLAVISAAAAEFQHAPDAVGAALRIFPRARLNGAAGAKRFQAPLAAARAELAAIGQRNVANFARHVILAPQELALVNDAAANARADGDIDHQLSRRVRPHSGIRPARRRWRHYRGGRECPGFAPSIFPVQNPANPKSAPRSRSGAENPPALRS